MKILYVFNAGGEIDYFRTRIYNPLDLEFLYFFHAKTMH